MLYSLEDVNALTIGCSSYTDIYVSYDRLYSFVYKGFNIGLIIIDERIILSSWGIYISWYLRVDPNAHSFLDLDTWMDAEVTSSTKAFKNQWDSTRNGNEQNVRLLLEILRTCEDDNYYYGIHPSFLILQHSSENYGIEIRNRSWGMPLIINQKTLNWIEKFRKFWVYSKVEET